MIRNLKKKMMKQFFKNLLSNLSNEDKTYLKYSFYISVIISLLIIIPSLFINWWHFTWGLFIFIGNLASSIAYFKLVNNVNKITLGYVSNPKRSSFLNSMTSLLIYAGLFIISVLINVYTIFFCAFGIMIMKIVIIIKNFKPKKEVDKLG